MESRSAVLCTWCGKEWVLIRQFQRLCPIRRRLPQEAIASDGRYWSNALMTTETIVQHREAAFHHAWASSTRVGVVLVRECFEAPTALENQFILRLMGPLSGQKLLDVGAGLRASSVSFQLHRTRVALLAVSPRMG